MLYRVTFGASHVNPSSGYKFQHSRYPRMVTGDVDTTYVGI